MTDERSLLAHAIGAAKVAPVCDGDSQVVDILIVSLSIIADVNTPLSSRSSGAVFFLYSFHHMTSCLVRTDFLLDISPLS